MTLDFNNLRIQTETENLQACKIPGEILHTSQLFSLACMSSHCIESINMWINKLQLC